MKNVIIDIKGIQGIDGDDSVIEMSTLGTLSFRDGKFLLSYEENETLKPHTVKTLVKTEGDNKITMVRSGGIDSRLIIEKGKRNTCFYSVPQGELVLGIFGEAIENSLNENGGKVKMSYTIDIDNSVLSQNTVEITVKEA
ncbi:MAG: DUF1934 domain-containing protein [Clostridia bacterium]|nr:DUF1934 domain-containing protein [Clostridia bacterium]